MPLVSVILTSYNYSRYLEKTIQSILAQSFDDFELLIIDDASVDGSPDIIKKYADRDPRIRPLYHNKNLGISSTQNEGIEESRGKYIAFCASDDLWHPDKLKTQLKEYKNDENIVVWSQGIIIDKADNLTGQTWTTLLNIPDPPPSGDIFRILLNGNFILGSSRMVKKENIGNIRWKKNLKYLGDYAFAVDLAARYHYRYIPEGLVFYRVHGDNTFDRDRRGYGRDTLLILCYFLIRYWNKLTIRDIIDISRCQYRTFRYIVSVA
ncbi:MAG TPA: glycosyltransferase [Methanolinea sp.]|nr:glycosyltransferase [Methanolinea sp.]HQK56764.1 glycosyltransferase [Methanolinea sp.]